jgi:hypothetical protein
MRVALLASTFALLASSPSFAQCVYVACNNGGGGGPVYQAPVAPDPVQLPQHNTRADYDAGFDAGMAARTTTHVRRTTTTRAVSRSGHRTAPAVKRHRASATTTSARRHTTIATRPAVRHVARVAPKATVRHVTRTAPRHVARVTHSTSYTSSMYRDPIKDRASTYGSASYGSTTSMASLMTTTTTWVRPSAVSTQNGQTCGWGARIVTNSHGQAQRQAMWVCQCPQGWRPPGY